MGRRHLRKRCCWKSRYRGVAHPEGIRRMQLFLGSLPVGTRDEVEAVPLSSVGLHARAPQEL